MGLQIVTPPSDTPITLDQAKAQLNVVDNDDDDLITEMIEDATAALDGPFGWLGRAIMPQTWNYFRDGFPGASGMVTNWPTNGCGCNTMTNCAGIEIPLPPLLSVDTVAYADPDNPSSYLTLAATEYAVDNAGYMGWVQPVDGWPSAASSINAIKITFQAGYATVPGAIRRAIFLMVRDFYDQRGSYIAGTILAECPRTVEALITPYKVYPL